ncbi:Transcription elongation factor [Aspergillus sclerotialis]|uniref:Transcription elongation factor 1 homolog n=1 Tax=Aspergillus sclerotialis TaxID=2070753 RepID=A0A3A2ZDN9_9EURO|nr:Transcription elongation factor [Aspergillus sclerotialis]
MHTLFYYGKRKKSSRQPQQPKKKEPLPTTFACLFCNHENSVVIKLDKKLGLGNLSCKVCGQRYQTGINYLSAAVDVYSDWVDACDVVARDTATKYEEDDPRNIRLSDHAVSTEQQLDTIPDANTHGDTYTDSY